MKRLAKRLASAVLALVMLAVVSVSGYAYPDFAPDTRYIDGFFNSEDLYCMRFGNFGINQLLDYSHKNNTYDEDTWMIYLIFSFKEDFNDNYVFMLLSDYSVLFFIDNTPFHSARYYKNDTYGNDSGIVAFIEADNPYLNQLANAKQVYYKTFFSSSKTSCVGFGDLDSPIAVTPKFEGLESYKTNNTVTNNTVTKAKDISTLEIDNLSSEVYEGEKIYPDPSIYDGDYLLEEKTDYTLTYKNNDRPGTGSVTIKGKGKYTGTKTLTFKITMKAPALTAKKSGNSKAVLSWKKVAGASGYEIYYSTNNGKFKKLTSVSGTTLGKTVTKLNFKKNSYKFKVRAVAKSSAGKSVYSSWSKTVKLG